MNCETVRARLHDLLESRLSGAELRGIEAHLDACPECAAVAGLLATPPPVEDPPDLADAVLARTTGPPCDRADEILCDAVDGTLESLDSELLQGHLDGCERCEALARSLARLADDLPAMAEIRPAPGFVEQVTAATLPRPCLAARWARGWAALVARPRIAWEAGYVGAVAVWLAVSLSGAPFQASIPLPSPPAPTEIVEEVTGRASTLGRRAWSATGGRGVESWSGLRFDLSRRYRRTEEARDGLRRNGERLGDAALQLDLQESGEAWKAMTKEARSFWERLTDDPGATTNLEANREL
jgi:hypothetical protein